MRRTLIVSVAALLLAVAAFPRVTKDRVNENCENGIELGLDSRGGNGSSLNFSSGLKACTDNEKRRWAFEGEALIVAIRHYATQSPARGCRAHFSLQTGIVYKWDHQPARNAARASWITRTRFVFTWGGEKR
jgi:hypothetical protein